MPEVPFLEWAMRVPEPKAGPLDFDRFPFQTELYTETGMLPEVVVMKATQIGISAYLVRETMYWSDVKGWTVIYIFPKQNLMWDFADARVKPLILGSKYLRGRVPRAHTQNKGLRQIGSGFVYYRGSESIEGLESIDADALALDEYDSLVAANVPVVERRLSGSPHGLVRRVGVPSVPGFGLDALYEKSDQRRWHVQCSHCKRWQPVFFTAEARPDDFELSAYVDKEQVRVVCGRCHKPVDVARGEWVPGYPDRDVRGYHASRLIVPAVARNDRGMLEGIIAASESSEPFVIQVHHNRDLGEAYAPKEGRLTLEAIQAAQRDFTQVTGYVGDNLVTAGIDVASVRALNVRISEHTPQGRKALFIGQVGDDADGKAFDKLDDILRRYGVHMFAIDHLPEGRLARSLCEKYPGRGYVVVLTGSATQKVFSVNEEERKITVRRTEAIDAMMSALRGQRNLLPLDLPEGYAAQMQAPVRFLEQDEEGKTTVGYRSSGADDYAMCEVFDTVASDAWLFRITADELQQGEIVALEDRLEFSRSHLNDGEQAGAYRPGPEQTGYSPGFGVGPDDEPGFNTPWEAWE